jgi:glyceraldehyde-3-phosphate dehydrogenase (NADP+)
MDGPSARPVVSPYDGAVVAEIRTGGREEVARGIEAALAAAPATAGLAAYERAEILTAVAAGIARRREEFAGTITAETGKPISFARAEVDRSVFTFSVAAEEARRMGGDLLPLDLAPHARGRFGLTRRFPLGVVAAITPFNFPLNLVAHKVAPALATGNAVVLKPSSSGVLTALLLGEVVEASGAPAGSLNIIPCSSADAGQLATDKRIGLISFTGSPEVGWGIKSRAGKKKVVLELGGNAGVILDEGTDLGSAVPRVASGAFGNAGQSCIAVQRVYVHSSCYREFREGFLDHTARIQVGDPRDPATVVGPMIDEASAAKVETWIREAAAGGAVVLCGGGRSGAVLQPTVLENVPPSASVSCREAFAPVVTIEAFDDFGEALSRVNASAYGLQAGVFTRDLGRALEAFRRLEVGGVVINDTPTFRIDHMPYGGVKDSGFGREGVRYAMEEMTELKLLVVNPL